MKNLKLLWNGLKKNIIPFIVLSIVFGSVLVLVNYSYSQYLYINRAYENFEKAQLRNAVHYINITPYDEKSIEDLDKVIPLIEEKEYVKKVFRRSFAPISISNRQYQIELYDEDIHPKMYDPLLKGKWENGEDEDGIYNVVIAGVMPKDVILGDIITIKNSNSDIVIEAKLSGVIPYPPMIFQLGFYTNDETTFTADKFFSDGRQLYLKRTAETEELIDKYNVEYRHPSTSGLIIFNDDVTEDEKGEIRDLIGDNAEITEMETILENSKTFVSNTLKKSLPLPLFLLVVTMLSYISIAVLNIYKNRSDHTLYYVVGCSRKKVMMLSIFQVSLSLFIVTAAVSIGILSLKYASEQGIYTLPKLIFGWRNIFLTLSVSVFLYIVIFFTSNLIFKKFSPVEQLRMVKE